jgi:predicted Fe-Mo cluster-binding NifX family protein
MSITRVAIGTMGDKGLHDQVSEVFAQAKTFTVVNIENNKVKDSEESSCFKDPRKRTHSGPDSVGS